MRLLFFGRYNCNYSKMILQTMKSYGYEITYKMSKFRGEKIPKKILNWKGDYILSYRSLFILPKKLIENAKYAAINFHPAPPEYPGSGCINFALYDEVDEYGVTAHLMNEKIDNGRILQVRRFKVNKNDTLQLLLTKTHEELYNLCIDVINGIKSQGLKFIKDCLSFSKKETWVGKARCIKDLDNLQTISPNITELELKKIMRATYTKEYPPKINLHGYTFELNLFKSKN